MGFREDMLPSVQAFRNIAVDFGIRRFEVWLRLITYSGTRVGLGTEIVTDTYLGRVKLSDTKSNDIIAGTSITDAIYELGPFTPEHAAALALADTKSVSPEDLSPSQDGTPTEIYYVIKGPGLPDDGMLFSRVGDKLDRPFRYTVTVKNTGRTAT